MGLNRIREDSIITLQKRKTVADLISENKQLSAQVAALSAQLTDTQVALTEVYEQSDEQITDVMLAQAEQYEQNDTQNTDILLATAEVYEKLLALETRMAAMEGGAVINGYSNLKNN